MSNQNQYDYHIAKNAGAAEFARNLGTRAMGALDDARLYGQAHLDRAAGLPVGGVAASPKAPRAGGGGHSPSHNTGPNVVVPNPVKANTGKSNLGRAALAAVGLAGAGTLAYGAYRSRKNKDQDDYINRKGR